MQDFSLFRKQQHSQCIFWEYWFIYHYLLLIFILWWWVIFSLKNWKRKNYVLYTVEILLFVILAKVKILVPTFIFSMKRKRSEAHRILIVELPPEEEGVLRLSWKLWKLEKLLRPASSLRAPRDCAICDDFVLVALLRSRKKTEGEGGSSRGAATWAQ
jgi:hypothetical protein